MRARTVILISTAAVGLALFVLSLTSCPKQLYAAPLAQTAETEPNNTFAQANNVAVPANLSGVITITGTLADTDFFSMTTEPGRTYQALLSIASADKLILRIRVYDINQELQGTSSSSYTSIEYQWTAYGTRTYLQIQESDPATTTKTANYQLEIVRIAATPTPSPLPTSTATPIPPATSIPGADSFEPNYDCAHAATIGTDVSYSANFVPWSGAQPDNDFYKLWVKPGLLFTCETMNLDPGVDTNIIFYNNTCGNFSPPLGNDDRAPGDYSSYLAYFSTYEGWLYILVGHGGRLPLTDVSESGYSIRCTKSAPGATSTPAATSTPRPPATPAPPPTVAAATAAPGLAWRTLTTPAPPVESTPATRFVPIQVLIYYDANGDGQPGAGEGVAGVSVQAYEAATNQLKAQSFTDEQGSLRDFTVSARGPVRVSIPFFGFSQIVTEEAVIYLRIPPRAGQGTSP